MKVRAVRLAAHLQQREASMESLLEDVRGFANGAGLHDDATVVMLRSQIVSSCE